MPRPPRLRFATLLLGVVLSAALPALGFGALAAWQAVESRQAAAGERLRETAHALALGLDREIDRHIGIARGLAAAEALDGPDTDLARFEAQARRVASAFGTSVVLLDAASLRELVDTAQPSPMPAGGIAPEGVLSAARIGLPVVTDLLAEAGSAASVAGVAMPVVRGGRTLFVLLVRLDPEVFRRVLVAQDLPAGLFASLTDSRGLVMARSDALHAERFGRPIPEENRRHLAAAPTGIYRARSFDGTVQVFGFQRLVHAPRWTVVAAQPAAIFDAAWRDAVLALSAGVLLALVFGGGLAVLAARAVLVPVRRMEAYARALADGGTQPVGSAAAIPAARVAELEALRRGFAEAEAAVAAREVALADSEARLRRQAERMDLALAAGAIIGTFDWDLTTDRAAVDRRFAETFGLDPAIGRAGLSRDQWLARVHPDDVAPLRAAIEAAVQRGGPCSQEYRVRGRDGSYRWLEANGWVDLAPDGTPLRFPGVLIDADRRRIVEAERDRATALLRAFVAAVPGVVYAKDRDGRMLVANVGVAALVGKPVELVLGRTDAEFLDDAEQAAAVMANDRRIMESGATEQVEEAVSLPDGTPAVWLSTKAPFRNGAGEVVGLIGSSVDITARIRVEARLRESEARLRLASEAGGIGFFSCNMVTGDTHWSETMYRLYGLDPAQPPPSMDLGGAHLDTVLPEDRAALQAHRAALVADPGAGDFAFEFRIRHAGTGETRWIASRGEFVRDAGGRVVLVRGAQQDVTERRSAADRLQLMVHELNHRVKNTLATVQSIAAQSLRGTDPAIRRGLEARILALAAAHDVLTQEGWAGADMDEVVSGVLAPHGGRDGARFRVAGPSLRLAPRAAVAISMALHEMVTNALKYGALSVPAGLVEIRWGVAPGPPPGFRLTWTERGGPLVVPPQRRGFGTRLVERSLAYDIGGTARIDFAPGGVVCEVEAPLTGVAAPAEVVPLPRVGQRKG